MLEEKEIKRTTNFGQMIVKYINALSAIGGSLISLPLSFFHSFYSAVPIKRMLYAIETCQLLVFYAFIQFV